MFPVQLITTRIYNHTRLMPSLRQVKTNKRSKTKFNYFQHSQPPPSETWFWDMSVGGSFRRVWGRAHFREMQSTGSLRDSDDRLRRGGGSDWLRMAFTRHTFSSCNPPRARKRFESLWVTLLDGQHIRQLVIQILKYLQHSRL